jgi:hypothetical protein
MSAEEGQLTIQILIRGLESRRVHADATQEFNATRHRGMFAARDEIHGNGK